MHYVRLKCIADFFIARFTLLSRCRSKAALKFSSCCRACLPRMCSPSIKYGGTVVFRGTLRASRKNGRFSSSDIARHSWALSRTADRILGKFFRLRLKRTKLKNGEREILVTHLSASTLGSERPSPVELIGRSSYLEISDEGQIMVQTLDIKTGLLRCLP